MRTPAPRGSGVRHHLPLDLAEPDPHPVVGSDRRRQLAGQAGLGRGPLSRGRALQGGQQRSGEDVEGQRGRDRVAGRAQNRRADRAVHRSEHHRVTGPDGHAVHRQGSGRFDHPGRVVVASGTGTGDQDDQVGVGRGLDQRLR